MNRNVILLTQFAVVYLLTSFLQLWSLEMVCIHKSYIVYFEISVMPIGHGFSFFGHGSHAMLEKRRHPVLLCGYPSTGPYFKLHFVCLSICLVASPTDECEVYKVACETRKVAPVKWQ